MADNHETATGNNDARRGVSIRIIGAIAIAIAILLAFYAFALASRVTDAQEAMKAEEEHYVSCVNAIEELRAGSDYLTTQARMFVVTGRRAFMDAYVEELTVSNRRGNAVLVLKSNLEGDSAAAEELSRALAASDKLAESELTAMNLAASSYHYTDVPKEIAQAKVSSVEAGLTDEGKIDAAKALVLGSSYDEAKAGITARVEASSQALLDRLNASVEASDNQTQVLLFQLRVAVALLLCVVMVLVLVLFMYVLKPLGRYVRRIQNNEPLEADGAYELHYLATAYNAIYEDNGKRIEQLREVAERDPLTGISNRAGYESFLATHTRNVALVLFDIDDFKGFNSAYGHDTGDAVMVKLAGALGDAFRSTDFPCRLGSDKFAVVMTNTSPGLRDVILSKVELVNSMLANDADDLPLVTLSVGAAFSVEGMTDQQIYEAAEDALKHAREKGRNTVVFYGEYN